MSVAICMNWVPFFGPLLSVFPRKPFFFKAVARQTIEAFVVSLALRVWRRGHARGKWVDRSHKLYGPFAGHQRGLPER
jgi:hypothetical protein